MALRNPFAFRPGPVSFWTTVIYLALFIPLIYVHEHVPDAPADHALYRGLNLTEAWLDLQSISSAYHPYNSHENDIVRQFIIQRSKEILKQNGIEYTTEALGGVLQDRSASDEQGESHISTFIERPPGATLFDDQISNVTWTYDTARRVTASIGQTKWAGQYFEGNNFYVYIHGKDDPEGEWWLSDSSYKQFEGRGGVLVNCHFDSVATGYGATDDGMGCVSMLQLMSYFTSKDHQPKNGIVLLFNNAEEDGLLGARAFGYSPLLKFCHTFVNLEGAGAGGRAILFRTTDLQTAKVYAQTPYPFGSVVAANAFERGVIKSATDYEIWNDIYGQRGLDIAFFEPRARYHTNEDDTRHTSVNSIWHMLSAALATTQELSQITGTKFTGVRSDGKKDLVQNGKRSSGVWFDMFGDAWAVFALRGLFAWSLTLLVAGPLVLFAITYLLIRKDKYYFFATDIKLHSELNDDPVAIGGWKGFFRFPLAFIFAAGLTIASVFLLVKFNPLIVYSSSYAVWSMTLSLFYFAFWLIMRGSSFVRPSALQRGFVNIWLFIIGWAVQVAAAVAEDRMNIAAFYFTTFLQSAIFLSLIISLFELFGLPGKQDFARRHHDDHQARDLSDHCEDQNRHDGETILVVADTEDEDESEHETATETTPLRSGEQGYGGGDVQPSFANTYRRAMAQNADAPPPALPWKHQPYNHEQSWSGKLPSWPWIVQFLLLGPVPIIIIGSLGLTATSALNMTGTDGGSLLTPILAIGTMSILLLVPLTPFIHRVTHHVPMFLLCVFVGTLIYNLVVFPFSVNHRFKFYFQQVIDLDENTNVVSLTGLEEYTRQVINTIPIAAGQHIECQPTYGRDLMDCEYDASALPPNLVDGKAPKDLMSVTFFETSDESVVLNVDALDTRTCYLHTSRPIFGFSVGGGGQRDDRFGGLPPNGFQDIQVWRRDRSRSWNITLELNGKNKSSMDEISGTVTEPVEDIHGESKARTDDEPLEVRVSCAWSDANNMSRIPAFHELRQYMPSWAAVTKKTVGLVEVRKTYKVPE